MFYPNCVCCFPSEVDKASQLHSAHLTRVTALTASGLRVPKELTEEYKVAHGPTRRGRFSCLAYTTISNRSCCQRFVTRWSPRRTPISVSATSTCAAGN